MRCITRNIWILSLVSLFTNVASEMLYPIMPIYLKSIGFSIIPIGLLEEFEDTIANISKAYYANLSGRFKERLSFMI